MRSAGQCPRVPGSLSRRLLTGESGHRGWSLVLVCARHAHALHRYGRTMTFTIVVNGSDQEVPGDGRQTLLDALRDDLGFTGPKLGCGEGACGACTLLVGSRAVQACQVQVA